MHILVDLGIYVGGGTCRRRPPGPVILPGGTTAANTKTTASRRNTCIVVMQYKKCDFMTCMEHQKARKASGRPEKVEYVGWGK